MKQLSRMEEVVFQEDKNIILKLRELKQAIENKRRHWNRPLAY